MFLIKTATRRDINDEETAILCAQQIGDQTRLKMLYLLTVADSISTGPKAWNDWIAVLLRDLTLKVLNVLESGELASRSSVITVETKKEKVLEAARSSRNYRRVKPLVKYMSPRYLLYTPLELILVHVQLFQQLVIDRIKSQH